MNWFVYTCTYFCWKKKQHISYTTVEFLPLTFITLVNLAASFLIHFFNSRVKNSNCIQTRIIANLLLITYIFILHVQSHDPFLELYVHCTWVSFLKKIEKSFAQRLQVIMHLYIYVLWFYSEFIILYMYIVHFKD